MHINGVAVPRTRGAASQHRRREQAHPMFEGNMRTAAA